MSEIIIPADLLGPITAAEAVLAVRGLRIVDGVLVADHQDALRDLIAHVMHADRGDATLTPATDEQCVRLADLLDGDEDARADWPDLYTSDGWADVGALRRLSEARATKLLDLLT